MLLIIRFATNTIHEGSRSRTHKTIIQNISLYLIGHKFMITIKFNHCSKNNFLSLFAAIKSIFETQTLVRFQIDLPSANKFISNECEVNIKNCFFTLIQLIYFLFLSKPTKNEENIVTSTRQPPLRVRGPESFRDSFCSFAFWNRYEIPPKVSQLVQPSNLQQNVS